MPIKTIRSILLAAVVVLFTTPSPAFACAACFGASDSDLARGMNWGIFSLLFVVVFVLSSIATFFIHLARRAALVSRNETLGAVAAPHPSQPL